MGTQRVIASRDVKIFFEVDGVIFAPGGYQIQTGSSLNVSITGNTEDIGAISTDEPIATDNGGTTYDLSLSLQEAEAQDLKDTIATATAANAGGSIAHIRQLIEAVTITVEWSFKRSNPKKVVRESYQLCTGVEETDSVERRGTETTKTWRFRSRQLERKTLPF